MSVPRTLHTDDGLALEAEVCAAVDGPPRAGVVLCHPHPQYGGTMRSIVVSALIQNELPLIFGVVMIVMGLAVMGLLRAPILYRERRAHPSGRPAGMVGTMLLGMAFAFGWTPCVGPILASILFYAGAAETVGRGALLLLVYSLGLGVPFVLTGVGFTHMLGVMGWVRRHYGAISAVSGTLTHGRSPRIASVPPNAGGKGRPRTREVIFMAI